MRTISTRLHGILDYALAALLAVSPWALGFAGDGAETWVPVLAGAALAASALVTAKEFGAVPRLDIPVHLWTDGLIGVIVAISPWVLGFERDVWIPHVVLGVLTAALAFFTDTVPGYERRRGGAERA